MANDVNYIGGVLDAEYEVLEHMSKEDVITYLIEGFGVSRELATEAVEAIGAWEDEDESENI